jgi:pyruvate dehydrogenase E2 component (dihydrolipoamide acetyltransferase)
MGVFAMPSLGADMESGKLVEWMIKPGDAVNRGDVVAVVETQKGAIEIECFEEGTVESLDADLGAMLPVGAPLATILAPGEAAASKPETKAEAPAATPPAPETKPEPKPAPVPAAEAPPAPSPAPAPPPTAAAPAAPAMRPGEAPAASPAARVLATEKGVDLATLSGSGPGGAILLADVEAATGAAPAAPAPSAPTAKPGLDLEAMRTAIASAMARAKREIPHYYLSLTVDLQPAADWLAETNAARDPDTRILMGALFVKAAARAAARVSEINGQYGAEGFKPSKAVHAGVAVALRGGGLIAPAIHDAETLSLDETMEAMKDVVARTRTGRLRSSEMSDGTITISSMGDTGADAIAAVIYPPQVAIVGFGAPAQRPWVVGDAVLPRTTVTVTLSADHRVSDGRSGAKFLAQIDKLLQSPEAL